MVGPNRSIVVIAGKVKYPPEKKQEIITPLSERYEIMRMVAQFY